MVSAIVSLGAATAATLFATSVLAAPPNNYKVIAQMFQWNWESVAAECTSFLGPAGYGYVQVRDPVSPAQEHATGSEWSSDYEPVSYNIISKRGNRAQYQSMIEACHAAGVGVLADTIWNHMSGGDSGEGVGGSSYTHYNYPGIYETQDFHHCGLEPGDDIEDYTNAVEIQTCELYNLADLATETEWVREKLSDYGNDLLNLGVDGMRLDAAEWINASDIANIMSRLTFGVAATSKPYVTQEVHWGANVPITPEMYLGNGDVQEFRYTTLVRGAFLSSGIAALRDLDSLGWIPGSQANVFVANHDTERSSDGLNLDSPSNTYFLGMVFSLAHPYGTPTILSSYTGFEDSTAGAPNGNAGTCSSNGGSNGWICQHRWIGVAGMVGFRNNAGSTALTDWTSPSSQQIAFGRGGTGFIVINNADADWTADFTTALPEGTYCSVIDGTVAAGRCSGTTITVSSSGVFTATIGPRNALAIHTAATI